MRHLNKSGAASALILALVAGIVAAASSGIVAVSKNEAAPAAVAVPADPLEALFAAPTNAACAARVAQLAAVVADDNDPRHSEAILALGLARTAAAREALQHIVATGAAADAQLAGDVLAGFAGSCAIR